jgi:hypothetical protein
VSVLARLRAALTPNRVALLTAGLLDVAALCSALVGVVPGSAARAVVELGALASAGAKAITFAIGSWKHAQLVADTSPDPSSEPDLTDTGGLPTDAEEAAAPPPSDVHVTEPAPDGEDAPREGPPVQPSQTGIAAP